MYVFDFNKRNLHFHIRDTEVLNKTLQFHKRNLHLDIKVLNL